MIQKLIHSLATIQALPKKTHVYGDTTRPRTRTLTLRRLGWVAEIRFEVGKEPSKGAQVVQTSCFTQ